LVKNVIFAFLQFFLFLLVFLIGSFLQPLHLQRAISVTAEGTRVFIWDGLLLAALLFVVILLIEAARKRIRSAGLWTTLAFAVATVAGLAAKFGFKTNY
jgi:hypothetical protein